MMCEKSLISSLTVENVAAKLALADLVNAQQLKSWAINFINMYEYFYRYTRYTVPVCRISGHF